MKRQIPKHQLPKYSDFPTGTPVVNIMRWLSEHYANARSKTDLQDWTGCPPMHLNREPVEPEKKDK